MSHRGYLMVVFGLGMLIHSCEQNTVRSYRQSGQRLETAPSPTKKGQKTDPKTKVENEETSPEVEDDTLTAAPSGWNGKYLKSTLNADIIAVE